MMSWRVSLDRLYKVKVWQLVNLAAEAVPRKSLTTNAVIRPIGVLTLGEGVAVIEVKLTLIVVRATFFHPLLDRETVVADAFERSQDILAFTLAANLFNRKPLGRNQKSFTSGSIVHSSRSRHEEASGPIIKPPEHIHEKLPGLLRHSPPLQGFSRLRKEISSQDAF